MGHTLRPYRRRGRVNLDWALVAVGLMASAVLAGSVIRTDGAAQPSQFGTRVGGLRTLSATDTLVLFEDMSSGRVTGWSGGERIVAHPGLGAIWLARPASDPLSRTIALPEGTVRAVLTFDLIAIGDWALEGLEVTLGGRSLLLHRFASANLDPPAPEARTLDRVTLRTAVSGPQDPARQRLGVEIAVTTPGDSLSLSIAPVPAEDAEGDRPAPLWAVDNLIVVSERLP